MATRNNAEGTVLLRVMGQHVIDVRVVGLRRESLPGLVCPVAVGRSNTLPRAFHLSVTKAGNTIRSYEVLHKSQCSWKPGDFFEDWSSQRM